MKKTQENYAFIDGQNLNLSIQAMGWHIDWRRFRVYLSEKYGVDKAYYFIGYVPGNNDLYNSLQSYGYSLIFKPISMGKGGKTKGNCDAELVLQAMIDFAEYQKAVLVTSDGDFACLVNYLKKMGKLECVLASSWGGCSHLLKSAAGNQIAFMDNLRAKLEYQKKRTP
jgi:uncharacterized LabA/DUF88 family protein